MGSEASAGGRRPKDERRESVKAKLQAALSELAATRSFSDLRVDGITGLAGLSRSAFYYEGEYEPLIETTWRITRTMFSHSSAWWSGTGDSRELIVSALTADAETFVEHSDMMR